MTIIWCLKVIRIVKMSESIYLFTKQLCYVNSRGNVNFQFGSSHYIIDFITYIYIVSTTVKRILAVNYSNKSLDLINNIICTCVTMLKRLY